MHSEHQTGVARTNGFHAAYLLRRAMETLHLRRVPAAGATYADGTSQTQPSEHEAYFAERVAEHNARSTQLCSGATYAQTSTPDGQEWVEAFLERADL
jgi:hypothetical protein